MKKTLALILALVLALSVLTVAAAEEPKALKTGLSIVATMSGSKDAEKAAFEQKLLDAFGVGLVEVNHSEILSHLRVVGCNADAEQLTTFATFDGNYSTTDGRNEAHAFGSFVYKQRTAGEHLIAFFHHEFGLNTVEVGRANCILLSGSGFTHICLRCFAYQLQVESFLNFE